jgi:hypothetical protein
MATQDQLIGSISPGSIPYGERQNIEAAIGQIGAAPAPAGPITPATGSLGIPSNPLDPLVGGQLPVNPDPVTAGLSMGPGTGGVDSPIGIPPGSVERLRTVALNARSPVLRELARRALRSQAVELRRG